KYVPAAQRPGYWPSRGENEVLTPAAETGGHVTAAGPQQRASCGEREVPGGGDDRVVTSSDGTEASPIHLDHPCGPELAEQIRTRRGKPITHRRHLHPLGNKQLHQRRPDRTGRTMHEDSISTSHLRDTQTGMGVVRPLHPRRRLGQVPSLRNMSEEAT